MACVQLYVTVAGARARSNAAFGQGVGDIFLDNVVCDGNELRLIDCASNPLAAHNCLHSEDAGAVCQPAISRMKHLSSEILSMHGINYT